MTRKNRIQTHLQETLAPLFMEVQNESENHHVPRGSETHFKLVLVSEKFIGMSRIARHKLIYELLDSELKNGLHALSLHLYTPEDWKASQQKSPASPACQDGYDREPASSMDKPHDL